MLKEKEALEKTIDMWHWLFENPFMSKRDYFENKKLVESTPNCLCYCCQFALERYCDEKNKNIATIESMSKEICKYCPIPDWGGDEDDESIPNCEALASPYKKWIKAMNKYYDGEPDITELRAIIRQSAVEVADLASKQLAQISD